MTSQRRVVAITGAGGALGAAIAQQLASEAATDLVLSDVSAASLEATGAALPATGSAIETILADVSDFSQVESVIALAVKRFGHLDVVIGNAGVLSANGRIHNLDTEEWERAFRINVLGAVNNIRAAVAVMRPQGSGSIVLTASVSGLTAWTHAAPYCATKAAVIQLAKVAAIEYCTRRNPSQLRVPRNIPVGDPCGSSPRCASYDRREAPLGARNGGRPRWCVLVSGGRCIALDDRIRDRRRRGLLSAMRAADRMPTGGW